MIFTDSLITFLTASAALGSGLIAGDENSTLWADYLTNWTFWNHVRTAASLGAAALHTIALVYLGK